MISGVTYLLYPIDRHDTIPWIQSTTPTPHHLHRSIKYIAIGIRNLIIYSFIDVILKSTCFPKQRVRIDLIPSIGREISSS